MKQINYFYLNNPNLYLIFHTLGWLLVFGNEAFGLLAINSLTTEDLISTSISIGLACIVTHIYRKILHSFSHFKQKEKYLYLISFTIGVMGVSLFITILDTYLEWWILGDNYFNWVDFTSLLLNIGRYVMMWFVLYYFYQLGIQWVQETEELLKAKQKTFYLQSQIARLQLVTENWKDIFMIIEKKMNQDIPLARQLITDFSEILRDFLNYQQISFVSLEKELEIFKIWFRIQQYGYDTPPKIIMKDIPKEQLILHHSLLFVINFIFQNFDKNKEIIVETRSNKEVAFIFASKSNMVINYFKKDTTMKVLQEWFSFLTSKEDKLLIKALSNEIYEIDLPLIDSEVL